MPENKLGKSRRSHCIGNFGPGAIVEFRPGDDEGAAISAIVAGLEHWDSFARPPGLKNPQVAYERRLQKFLGVDGFRLPPIDPDADAKTKPYNYDPKYLSAIRFPTWLQCPKCQILKPASKWQKGPIGNPTLRCQHCSDQDKDLFVFVVPARFVLACRHGHLQEFPWDKWVRHKPGCKSSSKFKLSQSDKAGLAGLILECSDCGATQAMEGAFGKETMEKLGVGCNGWRPWLEDAPNLPSTCKEVPRAMQRGASNIYFPVVASALAIPPFTQEIQIRLDEHWIRFQNKPPEKWPAIIDALDLEQELGLPATEIIQQVNDAMNALGASDIPTIRWEEFAKLSAPLTGDHVDFDVRHEPMPPTLEQFFDRLVRVVRLREVRALRGFTRIKPPSGELEADSPTLAPLCLGPRKNWLPAIEVRGEGIFLRFKESAVLQWEADFPIMSQRAAEVDAAYASAWHERHESVPPRTITPRFLLVHSLAHALMRQLTLSCGYSSASLRERLFVDEQRQMAALLIYTATADSDGSLGGLERQGRSDRMNEILPAALRAIQWCSNDPLCIQDVSNFTDAQNRAACHACMMTPETSCEEFNVLLDRATLIGLPENGAAGFFAPLLNPLAEL